MARGLTAAVITEINSGRLRVAIFVSAVFTSGTSYFWNGITPIVWNGQTWVGVGTLGQISEIAETTDVAAVGIVLSLSGIPQGLINQALGECRQGAAVKVWIGTLDAVGAVIADPYQCFAGRMDVPTIGENGETSTISITVENRLIDLQRSRERRYTHEDQQIDFAGDLGFAYVASVQEWNGVWGKGPGVGSTGPGMTTGNCFCGNTRLVTQRGDVRFCELTLEDHVMTRNGLRPIADIQVHEDFNGEMRHMGDGELVTPEHIFLEEGGEVEARTLYAETASFTGAVYNLHVQTEDDGERHYMLTNGRCAHNKIASPTGYDGL